MINRTLDQVIARLRGADTDRVFAARDYTIADLIADLEKIAAEKRES